MPVERPDVSGTVETWQDISQPELASGILKRILAEGDAFLFDRMGHDEPLRHRFDLREAVSLWSENASTREGLTYGVFIAEKRTSPHGSVMVHWRRRRPAFWLNSVSVWADEEHFRDSENVRRFLDFLVDLFVMVGAGYGEAYHSAEREEKGWIRQTMPDGRRHEETIAVKSQEGLIDLWWANLFGPPYVDLFNEERIDSCPAREVRKVGPKGYLLVTAPGPFDWSSPSVRELQERAKRHLGPDAFFDRTNPSRKPRAPFWPPE